MTDDTQARFLSLMHAVDSHFKSVELTDAFDNIVKAYFEEYTDATEIDPQTFAALKHLFDICFWDGETADDRTLEQVCGMEPLEDDDEEWE